MGLAIVVQLDAEGLPIIVHASIGIIVVVAYVNASKSPIGSPAFIVLSAPEDGAGIVFQEAPDGVLTVVQVLMSILPTTN